MMRALWIAVVVSALTGEGLQVALRRQVRRPLVLWDSQDEYYDALEEVETAAARLRAAERRLSAAAQSVPVPRPLGARSTLERSDAGTLLLTVPAAGFTASTAFGLAFSAAWFSAIGPATVGFVAARAVASAAFLAPFWVAGGMTAKATLLDPAKTTTLSIGEYAWDLAQTLPGGLELSNERGATEDLAGADVAVTIVTNGVPAYACRLVAGDKAWGVGDGLAEDELEWIASEINDQLAAYARARVDRGDDARPPPPSLTT